MRPLLCLCACLTLWGGCLLAGSNRDETVRVFREFNADLRWGRHELFLPRMAPAQRARFAAQLQALEDIEFLDEEMTGLDVQRAKKGPDKAQCRVDLSWTDRRTGIVQKTSVVEHWETAGAGWVVVRIVRARGAKLGFFDEPPLPKAAKDAASEQPQGQPDLGQDGVGPR